jgi:hypothetical protein
MKTIQEVNQAIMFGTWTNVELSSMMDAVKWNRAQLANQVKRSIGRGTYVKFTSNRSGMVVAGQVEKVAIKFATVNTPGGRYKVPMNMLEVDEQPF